MSVGAPAGCPGRRWMLRRMRELDESGALDWHRFERIAVHARRLFRNFEVTLEFERETGIHRRQFTGKACRDVFDAAGVVLALALQPGETPGEEELPEPSQPSLRALPAAEPALGPQRNRDGAGPSRKGLALERTPVAPDHSAPLDAARPPLDAGPGQGGSLVWQGELAGVVDLGTLPGYAPGLRGGLSLLRGRTSIGAVALYLPPVESGLGNGQAVAVQLAAAGLRGCRDVAGGLSACVGAEVGRLGASGVTLLQGREVAELWVAPHLGFSLRSPLGEALAITSTLDLLRPLRRARYRVDESTTVHSVPPLTARISFGVVLPSGL